MLAKTKVVVTWVNRSRLKVWGVLAVEILAGDATSYQIVYVTKETKRLILSRTCLEQLVIVFGGVLEEGDWDVKQVEGQGTGSITSKIIT